MDKYDKNDVSKINRTITGPAPEDRFFLLKMIVNYYSNFAVKNKALIFALVIWNCLIYEGYANELDFLAKFLAKNLDRQYKKLKPYLKASYQDCERTERMSLHLLALREMGKYDECIREVERCLSEDSNDRNRKINKILIEGAVCATSSFRFQTAEHFLKKAIEPQYNQTNIYKGSVYLLAHFIYKYRNGKNLKKVINLVRDWNKDLLLKIIDFYHKGGSLSSQEFNNFSKFVRGVILGKDPLFKEFLLADFAYLLQRRLGKNSKSLHFLKANIKNLRRPTSWFKTAYKALFHQKKEHFFSVIHLYKAYLPYFHPKSVMGPVERSIYTYSKLREKVCIDNLLKNNELLVIKKGLLDGELDEDEALKRSINLEKKWPEAADLLTFIGSLYLRLQNNHLAQKYFYKAHNSCPYYNRAHRGLKVLQTKKEQRAYPDYISNLNKMDAILSTVNFDEHLLNNYILNWPSLTSNTKKKLKYAIRFFRNHLDSILNGGAQLYLKDIYELLSETPFNHGLANLRVWSNSNKKDNRLYDDIRGIGGKYAVAEIYEMEGASQGEFNLAGHEMAHQLHHFAFPSTLKKCITKLYKQAQKRNLFADPYSALNEDEYFAQGVSYYLIPAGAPLRFGLNINFFKKNDRNLYNFLKNIEQAHSIEEILCSI